MNTPRLFKICVVSFILLFVGAVYVYFLFESDEVELSSNDVNTLTHMIYLGPRSPVEVQDPLPHRPVQEYEVE